MTRADELQAEVDRLHDELDRYRTATEDTLDSLDWVIGYLDHERQTGLARALRRNRMSIVRGLRTR